MTQLFSKRKQEETYERKMPHCDEWVTVGTAQTELMIYVQRVLFKAHYYRTKQLPQILQHKEDSADKPDTRHTQRLASAFTHT